MSVAGADAPDELPPWALEFKRKFSDNPTRAARYRRGLSRASPST